MELCPNPIRGAFPRLKPFRMFVNFLKPAQQLGFDFGLNLLGVGLQIHDLAFVLIKPLGEPPALRLRELQHGVFKLFDTHGFNLRFCFGFGNRKIAAHTDLDTEDSVRGAGELPPSLSVHLPHLRDSAFIPFHICPF